MGYRLMVGQRILIPSVLVRVQVAQPNRASRQKWRLFLLFASIYSGSNAKFRNDSFFESDRTMMVLYF